MEDDSNGAWRVIAPCGRPRFALGLLILLTAPIDEELPLLRDNGSLRFGKMAPPVTISYDHGVLAWSKENADAEQERKADTRDRDFQV